MKKFVIMLVVLCCGALVSCGGNSHFKEAKNTSVISQDNVMKSSSLPAQIDTNSGETATGQPQKKNAIEELSGEIGRCNASDWEKRIDENKRYIFVLTNYNSTNAIFRIDKATNERYTEEIRCLDLDSGKDDVARKLEDKEKKSHYAELFTYGNQLCYVLVGQQRQICILGEKREDPLLLSLEKDQVWRRESIDHFDRIINYDENLLYYIYTKDEQSWLCCYDEGEKLQMKLPEDYREGGYVCDGYFFYSTGESGHCISKCISIND